MSDIDLKFKRVAVIGVGTMGSQIAEMLSLIGNYEVNISDSDSELVDKGYHLIEENLEHFYIAKGKMSPEEKKKVLKRGDSRSTHFRQDNRNSLRSGAET